MGLRYQGRDLSEENTLRNIGMRNMEVLHRHATHMPRYGKEKRETNVDRTQY